MTQVDTTALNSTQASLLTRLAQSRAGLLTAAREGRLDLARLAAHAGTVADWTVELYLAPLDPVEHLLAAHAYARPYLTRLTQHSSQRVVIADETHNYTPRKILRRILDHALDHLNQIEQWLAWQVDGTVPEPTDGWATSEETLAEDLQPLPTADLHAWLWRIDLAIGMVAQRARQLSSEQMDWTPPDGGFSLRQMLHHLARAERYYAIWMDEALPDDPIARYRAASERFARQLSALFTSPTEGRTLRFDDDPTISAEQVAQKLLAEEETL